MFASVEEVGEHICDGGHQSLQAYKLNGEEIIYCLGLTSESNSLKLLKT